MSVVIPARDAEAYLGEALASVAAQTREAHEVIVVDDGSTDGSGAIAERFGARSIRQEHGGAGAARNTGVAAASGEFIAFLDADDVWQPTKLERQLAAFADDPSIDLLFGHLEEFGSSPHREGLLPGHLVSALLARRSAFDVVGPFAKDLRAGEFVDWIARARAAGLREHTIPDHVVSRRIHDANSSRAADAVHEFPRILKAALDRQRAR